MKEILRHAHGRRESDIPGALARQIGITAHKGRARVRSLGAAGRCRRHRVIQFLETSSRMHVHWGSQGNPGTPLRGAKAPVLLTSDQESAELDDSEVLPLPIFRLQLVDTAIVGVEKVAAVRNRVMVRRTHGAAGPASTTRSSPTAAVFAGFLGEFDAVLNFVLDAGEPCGHQTTTSLQLFFCHNRLRCNNLAKGFALPRATPLSWL